MKLTSADGSRNFTAILRASFAGAELSPSSPDYQPLDDEGQR